MARIGIVLTHLDPDRMGGAETYCRHLVHHLQKLQSNDQFILFVGRDHGLEVHAPNFQLEACRVDPRHRYRRILWEQAFGPSRLARQRLDLIHFPYGTVPLRQAGPYVATVHDSQRFSLPHSVGWLERCYRAVIETGIARRGQPVIGVSSWDAGVLRDRLGLRAERVFVIPYGVSQSFRSPRDKDVLDTDNYLLWVGRPYGRKNVGLLMRAMQLLKSGGVNPPTLRVVGVERSYEAPLRRAARRLGVESIVSLERPIRHDQIPAVFRRARLFCYPSLYESVGIPVLEAMASGTPVLCADIPAFRALYDGAAILLDPHRPDHWSEAVCNLLEDRSRYRQLAEAGRQRAQSYTWQSTAQQTLDAYQRILGHPALTGRP